MIRINVIHVAISTIPQSIFDNLLFDKKGYLCNSTNKTKVYYDNRRHTSNHNR